MGNENKTENQPIKRKDLRFVTEGKMCKEVHEAIFDVSLRKSVLFWVVVAVCLFDLVCGSYFVAVGKWVYVLLSVMTFSIFAGGLVILRNYSIKLRQDSVRKLYHKDAVDYMSGFTKDVVYAEYGRRHDAYVAVPLQKIKYMWKTRQYRFIGTSEGALFVVFRNGLSAEDDKALDTFLRGRTRV